MKNYKVMVSIFMVLTLLGHQYAIAEERENIKETCAIGYKNWQELKDFLYRFDGNLSKIDEGKIEYINRKLRVYEDRSRSEEVRRSALKDIFYDPDYLKWTAKNKASNLLKLINEFDKLEILFGEDEVNFRYLIEGNVEKKNEIRAAYQRISDALEVSDEANKFLFDLNELVQRAEVLGREDIFKDSLKLDDSWQYGYEMGFLRNAALTLPRCWITILTFSYRPKF